MLGTKEALTDDVSSSINTVFDEFLHYRAQIDDDLARLDLVNLPDLSDSLIGDGTK